MTLPVVNKKIAWWRPKDLLTHKNPPECPFSDTTNTIHNPMSGFAEWKGDTLTFVKPTGVIVNYWYVPAVPKKVSYCVVPSNLAGPRKNVYIVSDQFGGCEYHVLKNEALSLLAFLHIYRGEGKTVQYKKADGWEEVYQRRSASLARAVGMNGSIISVSWVHKGIVDTTFAHLTGDNPPLNVSAVNDGTAAN